MRASAQRLFQTIARLGELPKDSSELGRRLPWLLVFRVAVATALMVLALLADWQELNPASVSQLLYAVIFANYAAVLGIGVLLRARAPAHLVAGLYLAFTTVSAAVIVHATFGREGAFTFLYLLAILDGAIIGGRKLAMLMAIVCSTVLGLQTLFFSSWPRVTFDRGLISSSITNLSAFYLTALLGGHLAELSRRASAAATRATASLAHMQAMHAAMLQALPVGVLAVDDELKVYAINPRAQELLDWPAQEPGELLPEALRASFPAAGELYSTSLEIDAGERTLSILRSSSLTSTLLSPHEGGRPLQIVVIEDRTELTSLARRLAIEERLAALGRLAAAIAHEIRNPLAAISGSLELLFSNEAEPETTAPLQAIVRRELERLDRLVDDFLQFAKPSPMELLPVDAAALTRGLCAVMRKDPALSGRALSLCAPDRLMARLDAERFQQLLWNLVRNAAEASRAEEEIELTLTTHGKGLVLEVRDHGTGLTPEIRRHLFEPFHTTKATGTGLGLAVVRRIAAGHGGQIELVDAPGGGTIARVTLPVANS